MIEEHPKVSVIVPMTRPELSTQALASIRQQCYKGEIETIVVEACDHSLAQPWSITSVNRGPVPYPGKARNLGVSHATGDVLLFLDDDCTVEEDWVARNVQALKQPAVGVVGARIRGKSGTFFARGTDFANFGDYQHGRSMDIPVAAASMAMPRKLFHAISGFDETKRSSEDMDGRESGLTTKILYQSLGLKNRLLASVRFPPLFLLLLPLIAIAATARIVIVNVRTNPEVLLYVPVIFLAKLVYEFGVFRHLLSAAATMKHFS